MITVIVERVAAPLSTPEGGRVVLLLADGAEVVGKEVNGGKDNFDGSILDSLQGEDGTAVGVSGRPERQRLVQGGGRVPADTLAVASRGR